MKTKQQNKYASQLTEDEIRQVREMLQKSSKIEEETASLSKESFINLLRVINITLSIINKIQQIDWTSIQTLFIAFS
jgi:hypothetical protein